MRKLSFISTGKFSGYFFRWQGNFVVRKRELSRPGGLAVSFSVHDSTLKQTLWWWIDDVV